MMKSFIIDFYNDFNSKMCIFYSIFFIRKIFNLLIIFVLFNKFYNILFFFPNSSFIKYFEDNYDSSMIVSNRIIILINIVLYSFIKDI